MLRSEETLKEKEKRQITAVHLFRFRMHTRTWYSYPEFMCGPSCLSTLRSLTC